MTEREPFADRPRATVTVYGAGVSGLTVAHELALRNFAVTVVEAEKAAGPDGRKDVAIGGLAASQYDSGARARTFPGSSAERPDDLRLVGEHGYRFFPSYYHHLFDTMQRTPVYDDDGRPTRDTTYDNVRPCSTQATTTAEGHPLLAIPRDPLKHPLVAPDTGAAMRLAGFRDSDLAFMSERLGLFMSSSVERRRSYEEISSYDFFVGVDTPGGRPTVRYSEPFDFQLRYMPRVLAAFNAEYGDARTNIDNWVQMMLNQLQQLPKTDGILNGPTSAAWLVHWRRHLEHLSVRLVRGRLVGLGLDEAGRVVGDVEWSKHCDLDEATRGAIAAPDYTVVATDAVTAEEVTRDLPQVGIPRQLSGYTTTAPPKTPPSEWRTSPPSTPRRRDPRHQPGMEPWDRFQTLTGLQFFFDTEFEIMQGRVYYSDSEWGLSSINEQTYWIRKPTVEKDGYHAVVSVDVGNANAPSSRTGKSFMESSEDEIAEEVWHQIAEALCRHSHLERETLPTPRWYTIDDRLVFEGGRVVENKAPYLVPIVDDWQFRPGPEPWNPSGPNRPSPHLERWVWQAGHGGGWVHFDSLLFAGTYLRTFTRLTTMEAANESARHAVNAVLDHYVSARSDGSDTRRDPGLWWWLPEGYTGDFGSDPVRQPTPAGDYCFIRDMEWGEVPSLYPTRQLDAKLYEAGLPHPWVLTGIELGTTLGSQLVALLAGDGAHKPGRPLPTTPAELLDGLRAYRSWLEGQLAGDGAADRGARTDVGGPGPDPAETLRRGQAWAIPGLDLGTILDGLGDLRRLHPGAALGGGGEIERLVSDWLTRFSGAFGGDPATGV